MRSIRLSLLKWLLLPMLAINLVGAGLDLLAGMAAGAARLRPEPGRRRLGAAARMQQHDGRIVVDLPHQAEQVLRLDHFDSVYFVVRNAAGDTLAGDRDFPPLRTPPSIDEPEAYDSRMRGGAIRVIALSVLVGSERVTIGVGETLWKRLSVRSGGNFAGLLLLDLALTFISIAVVSFGVTRGLAPLQAMRDSLDARKPDDLAPLPDGPLALELAPVASAINQLLDRVRQVSRSQQDFLAECRAPAAHAAGRPQDCSSNGWQRGEPDRDEAARALSLMMPSTERMIRQTNQLLALARAEPDQLREGPAGPAVARQAGRGIGAALRRAGRQEGHRPRLRSVAGRHHRRQLPAARPDRQPGRQCDALYAAAWPGHGPLPRCRRRRPAEGGGRRPRHARRRARTGVQPLRSGSDHNTRGSGLGLAIVRDIAADHGAQISLDAGPDGRGTAFSVRFQLAPA